MTTIIGARSIQSVKVSYSQKSLHSGIQTSLGGGAEMQTVVKCVEDGVFYSLKMSVR